MFGCRLMLQRTRCRNLYQCVAVNSFSDLSLAQKEILRSSFRCPENNPIIHDNNHEGLFYRVSSEDCKRLFTFGGMTPEFRQKIKTFAECCIMARRPALEVINYLRHTNFDYNVNRYILYGVKGVGKTVTLAHVLHYISLQKWLILHVPWPAMWIRLFKEVTPSTYKDGRYDHPVDAVSWLQHFKLQNGNLLQELQPKLNFSYTWSSREKSEKDTLLAELIEYGINRPKFSSDCVGAIAKEAKHLATSKQVKVALVIDGVNSFFQKTRILRDDRSSVPAEDVTLIHAFMKLLKHDWNNGVVITSVDTIAMPGDRRESHLPRYLLTKKGFELMDPFIPIAVENYTLKEFESCLNYYEDRRWIQSDKGKTEEGRQQLMFLSGHNPEKLLELCGPL